MARLYPDKQTIRRLHQRPTKGEIALLSYLLESLTDEFEIFFQPFVNGDNPDIVVVKENCGVIIIEVKDWELEYYSVDEDGNWSLKKDSQTIKSPFMQVQNYKNNLINLHIDSFLQKNMADSRYYSVISTIVYFHKASEDDIHNFYADVNCGSEQKLNTFLKYNACWGYDSLNESTLKGFLKKNYFECKSKLFDDELYRSLNRYLQPPFHQMEEGITILYSKEQQELIRSEVNPRRKVKGIAGCGKTLVLAKRAVNAHIRTNKRILILTFNLSLKNYIHDRISEVKHGFSWSNFYITNYHQFIKSAAINLNLNIDSDKSYSDVTLFESVKCKINKYEVILIDEVQDYTTEWLEIITGYFLEPGGEFVVFGDEKQNIYNREMDENNEPIIKKIPGRWNKSLNVSRRFTSEIGQLAVKFQQEFLSKKYAIDELEKIDVPSIDFDTKTIQYLNLGITANEMSIIQKYKELIKFHDLHPSDICFLSTRIRILRKIDYLIRHNLKEKTTTTFETEEYYHKLVKDRKQSNTLKYLKGDIEKIRRHKKNHFWMKTGTTKLSSIHSFKGWEVHTLFLIIEPEENNVDRNVRFDTAELIYTGLTRAQINLFVVNLGNDYYDDFFKNNIEFKS